MVIYLTLQRVLSSYVYLWYHYKIRYSLKYAILKLWNNITLCIRNETTKYKYKLDDMMMTKWKHCTVHIYLAIEISVVCIIVVTYFIPRYTFSMAYFIIFISALFCYKISIYNHNICLLPYLHSHPAQAITNLIWNLVFNAIFSFICIPFVLSLFDVFCIFTLKYFYI